jgi:hypothetical protein
MDTWVPDMVVVCCGEATPEVTGIVTDPTFIDLSETPTLTDWGQSHKTFSPSSLPFRQNKLAPLTHEYFFWPV